MANPTTLRLTQVFYGWSKEIGRPKCYMAYPSTVPWGLSKYLQAYPSFSRVSGQMQVLHGYPSNLWLTKVFCGCHKYIKDGSLDLWLTKIPLGLSKYIESDRSVSWLSPVFEAKSNVSWLIKVPWDWPKCFIAESSVLRLNQMFHGI